ncbi:MAG: hypothetical protein HQ592_18930, partial [Planctomycetes bacterium]|nr:hypothetical protein [Planctomycetota bacterium]
MALSDSFRKAGKKGVSFRGAPFWSWNDDLDPKELQRQVREMARVGLGGHFMHARIGLITEYMGKHWMKCIRKTVQESKKAGIKAWLYDEDCWPSGCAGGMVAAKGAEYQAKQLRVDALEPAAFEPVDNMLCVFSARKSGDGYSDIKRIEAKDAASAEEVILRFHYANAGYVDLLSKKVVKAFIDVQYEPYRKALKKEFGKTIPGIFTDEPNYRRMPWTKALPKSFAKKKGYDILDVLPSLFFDVGDYRRARYDYWSTVTDLYVKAFSKQIYEWCDKHGLIFTGHYLCEDSLKSQIDVIGAAMPHYEFQHMPGIDHLMRHVGDPLLCKQVSSVAHQFGGRRVLSEMYGCSGWNVSFEELKWIGEWQYVQGVDLPCQHLELYSAKGCRKRDFPPSLFYQQPWWDDYRVFNDYFARLLSMLTRGKHAADVLVLHTIESAWTEYRADGSEEVDALNAELVGLTTDLLGMHRDFDFGDETIIRRHGKVSGDEFRVGKCRYKVVIVPRCITLRSTTLDLLEKFIAGGGAVLTIGPPPERMDGALSDRPAQVLRMAKKISARRASLAAALNRALPPPIAITDAKGRDLRDIWVQQRHHKEGELFFLANINPGKAFDAEIHIPIRGRIEELDCNSGEVSSVRCKAGKDGVRFPLHFFSKGSHLLLVRSDARPLGGAARKPKLVRTRKLADTWKTHRKEFNALTLDYCRYRADGGEWSDKMPVIKAQEQLNDFEREVNVELEFTFESRLDPEQSRDINLVMEEPTEYEILINGKPGPRPAATWWRDISFIKTSIDDSIVEGRNVILLRRNFLPRAVREALMETATGDEARWLKHGVEFESIYIVGDFGVACDSEITDAPRRAVDAPGPFALVDDVAVSKTGDLTRQGMPFFAGAVGLSQTFRLATNFNEKGSKVYLEMDRPDAIITGVTVNGRAAGKLVWQPFRLDVTKLLRPGEN